MMNNELVDKTVRELFVNVEQNLRSSKQAIDNLLEHTKTVNLTNTDINIFSIVTLLQKNAELLTENTVSMSAYMIALQTLIKEKKNEV